MKTPLISVILPFYNAEATLAETLDSIVGQTFRDFELIAVDDGSTDESGRIVSAYAKRDRRIRLAAPGRQGVVGAMNHGIELSGAPLVARMDADDIMCPERLAAQFAHMRDTPRTDILGTRVRLFPEERIQNGFREYIRWQNACITHEDITRDIYVELPIAHPSLMFRRQCVVEAGGYREGDFPEDYELMLRLFRKGCRFAKLPGTLVHWRESGSRLTRTEPRYSREAFDRLRARYLAKDERLKGRPLVFCGAGRKTRRRIDLLLEKGHQPSAWVDIDPKKIGKVIKGAPVVPMQWLDRPDRPLVLSYVNNHGARESIGEQLQAFGYRKGRDYLMVG